MAGHILPGRWSGGGEREYCGQGSRDVVGVIITETQLTRRLVTLSKTQEFGLSKDYLLRLQSHLALNHWKDSWVHHRLSYCVGIHVSN